MSIDRKVDDALADLEGLISDGVEIDQAIEEVATEHKLRSQVIRFRAEKRFGDLALIKARSENSKALYGRESQVRQAVFRYNEIYFAIGRDYKKPISALDEWLTEQLGSNLTDKEIAFAKEQFGSAWQRSLMRDLNLILDERKSDA